MKRTFNSPTDNAPHYMKGLDERLVSRVLNGEREVFSVLVRRYNQRVFRIARSILRDDWEAEDVAQQTMVMAFQKLERWRQTVSFSRWLTQIAANEAYARLRKRKRSPERHLHDRLYADNGNSGPETAFARQQMASQIEQAVGRLPPDQRTVFVLRDIEELNTAETARALDISEALVRVRLHRARAKLRETLTVELGSNTSDIFSFADTRCERPARV